MELLKGVQEAVPWLSSLSIFPKLIVSALIILACLFILVLLWTPPPEEAVRTILKECYRRSLFTRMHAQINVDAMFQSIAKCRESLQRHIPEIRRNDLQQTAVELLGTVEGIERYNPIRDPDDVDAINRLKLSAVSAFRQLAAATGSTYVLPKGNLKEDVYFTEQEADGPPFEERRR